MATAVEDGDDQRVDEVGAVGEPAERRPHFEREKGGQRAAALLQRDEGDPAEAERPEHPGEGGVGGGHLDGGDVALVGGQHRQDDAHGGEEGEEPAGGLH